MVFSKYQQIKVKLVLTFPNDTFWINNVMCLLVCVCPSVRPYLPTYLWIDCFLEIGGLLFM